MSKVYVDWEIEAIIRALLDISYSKGQAFDEARRHHALEPIPNSYERSVEWMGVQVIRQLQAQLEESIKLQYKPPPMSREQILTNKKYEKVRAENKVSKLAAMLAYIEPTEREIEKEPL